MPMMTRIPSDLHAFGLTVELVPGWETRSAGSFAPACVVDHWTAGPRGTTGRPSLSIVTNGRAGLPGPLCNVYLARNGVCVVVAAGRANHAGAGGFRGLIGNSAAYGIEAECGGDGDWTPEMLDAYPRLNAALLHGLGRDASWVAGHNEWAPTRKIDIRDVIASVRANTARVLANPTTDSGDDDMTPAQAVQLNDILREVMAARRQELPAIDAKLNQLIGNDADKNGTDRLGDLWEQEDRHHAELLAAILGMASVTLDPAAIAAAIPGDIAEQVAAKLAERLQS